MRLIDADELIKRHCKDCNADVQESCKTDAICSLLIWLAEEPTVDAVPVVRCEKCIHHRGLNAMEKFEYGSNVVWCNIPHFGGVLMKNDAFCSYGERKDD